MRYNYRYRLKPTDELHERLAWTVDTCRQVYNHSLHRLNRIDGTSAYSEQSLLPDLKRKWDDLKRKRRDFLHKLSNYYAREYDLVAVEDLDAKGLMELPSNSRNRASAAWGTFLRMLEYKCEREGTHFVAANPRGTTKECSNCGVSTEKPLWVREHSCPSCGFEADRNLNAAYNILSRGLDQIGVVHPDSMPAETALPTGTDSVPAKRVLETGSPVLSEAVRPSRAG